MSDKPKPDSSFIVEVTVGFYNQLSHRIPFASMEQAVRVVNDIHQKLSSNESNGLKTFPFHKIESMDGVSVFRVNEIVSVRACDLAAFAAAHQVGRR